MVLPTFSGLFLSLTIILCSFLNADASPQQITFFENLGCTGDKNLTFTGTQDSLDSTWVANSSSMHILGLWSVTIHKKLEGGVLRGYSFVYYNTKPPQGLCVDKTDWGISDPENYQVYSADPRGPADMTTSQIIFYTEDTFHGLEYVADKNETAKLPPRPFAMSSQLQFSKDSWTGYSEANFAGIVLQFRPEDSSGSPINAPDDYFQFKNEFVGIIGSVKRGDYNTETGAGCMKAVNKMVLLFTCLILAFKNLM